VPASHRNIPLPFFLGLVFGVYGTVAQVASWTRDAEFSDFIRWRLFDQGCNIVELVLVTYALFALANRLTQMERRATQIAAWASTVTLCWIVVAPVLSVWLGDGDHADAIQRWGYRVSGGAVLATTIAISIASKAWVRSPIPAIFAVIACLLSGWLPILGEELGRFMGDHETFAKAFWPGREIVWVLCMLAMVAKLSHDAAEPAPDQRATATGFRRASSALRFRIVAALVVACASMVPMLGIPVPTAVAIGAPAIVILSMIACAWGILDVERGRLPGMPRFRLALGAALVVWWAGVQLQQLVSVYAAAGTERRASYFSDEAWFTAWSMIGPLVGAFGLMLVGSAITSFAVKRGDEALRLAASTRTMLFVILALAGVGLSILLGQLMGDRLARSGGDTLLLVALAAAGASLGSLVALAGLCSRAAKAVEQTPGLPTARVQS